MFKYLIVLGIVYLELKLIYWLVDNFSITSLIKKRRDKC